MYKNLEEQVKHYKEKLRRYKKALRRSENRKNMGIVVNIPNNVRDIAKCYAQEIRRIECKIRELQNCPKV